MNQIHYPDLVAALVKPGEQIKESLTASDAHLIHMTMGICGEAGELLDAIKKATIYRKPLDLENVLEELGDIEFYLEGIRAALRITREACLTHNINKLSVRYKSLSYSDKAAQDREDKQ